jgi:hypothetical protein
LIKPVLLFFCRYLERNLIRQKFRKQQYDFDDLNLAVGDSDKLDWLKVEKRTWQTYSYRETVRVVNSSRFDWNGPAAMKDSRYPVLKTCEEWLDICLQVSTQKILHSVEPQTELEVSGNFHYQSPHLNKNVYPSYFRGE